MTKWIVVLEGQTHVGPFDDPDTAFDWIAKNGDNGLWVVEPLLSPESE